MYINKVTLYGNLTRDPELKALPSGQNVTSFSVATNRTFKDKNGQKVEQVEFHNLTAWGKQADLIAQYMKKGSAMFIEGRLSTRSWDDKKTGEKKSRTEIIVENFQFGPKAAAGGGGSYSGGGASSSPVKSSKPAASSSEEDEFDAPSSAGINYPKEEINPEDIPF